MNWHFVGVDLGQAKDFTAIAAVERVETAGAWDAAAFAFRKTVSLRLRYLERVMACFGPPQPTAHGKTAKPVAASRSPAG